MFIFVAYVVKGQDKLNIEVPFTNIPPSIDGIEDPIWDQIPAVLIEGNFQSELPTVTAYWKLLWDYSAIYVLVSVEDDDHWPGWVSGGSWYEYDQPELYFDVNDELKDGQGVTNRGTGHYQVIGKFADGISGSMQDIPIDGRYPTGKFC